MQTTIKKQNTTELKQVKKAIDHLQCYDTREGKIHALSALVRLDELPLSIASKIIDYLNL